MSHEYGDLVKFRISIYRKRYMYILYIYIYICTQTVVNKYQLGLPHKISPRQAFLHSTNRTGPPVTTIQLHANQCPSCYLMSVRCMKGITIPGQALRVPGGEASRFNDILYVNVVRLSAPSTESLYSPGNIPGTHFCQRWSRSQGLSAAGRIM